MAAIEFMIPHMDAFRDIFREDLTPPRTPATILRERLAAERLRGHEFDEAWDAACEQTRRYMRKNRYARAYREEWWTAIEWARPFFAKAYYSVEPLPTPLAEFATIPA